MTLKWFFALSSIPAWYIQQIALTVTSELHIKICLTDSINGDPPSGKLSLPSKPNGEEQFEDYGENDVGIEIDVQDLSSALDSTTEAVNGQSPSNRSVLLMLIA